MGDQCFQAQEVLRENGPCISAGCWLNFQGCRADCTMPFMYMRIASTGGLGNSQEWRWGPVLGLVLTDTEEHLYLQIGGTIQLTHIH